MLFDLGDIFCSEEASVLGNSGMLFSLIVYQLFCDLELNMTTDIIHCVDMASQTDPTSNEVQVREIQKIIEVPIEVPISMSPARHYPTPLAVQLQILKPSPSLQQQPLSLTLQRLLQTISSGNIQEHMTMVVQKLLSKAPLAESLNKVVRRCGLMGEREENQGQTQQEEEIFDENDRIVEREVRRNQQGMAVEVVGRIVAEDDSGVENKSEESTIKQSNNSTGINIPKIIRPAVSETERNLKKSATQDKLQLTSQAASARSRVRDDSQSQVRTVNMFQSHNVEELLQKCQEEFKVRYDELKIQTKRDTLELKRRMDNTVTVLNAELSAIKEENNLLVEENTSLKANLHINEDKLSSVVEQLQTSRTQTLDLMEQLNSKTYTEAKNGLEDIKQWEGYVQQLTSEKEGLKGLIEGALGRSKMLKQKNELLTQELNEYKDIVKLSEEENKALTSKLQTTESQLQDKETMLTKLRVDKANLKRLFQQINADNQQLKTSYVDPAIYEQVLQQNQRQSEYLLRYEQDISYLTDMVDNYRDLLAKGDQIVGALCKQYSGDVEHELMQVKYRETMAKLKSRQTSLVQQGKDLNRLIHEQNKQLLKEMYQLCDRNSELAERLEVVEKQNQILRTKMHRNSDSRIKQDYSESRRTEGGNVMEQLTEELEDERAANIRLRRQIMKLNRELKGEDERESAGKESERRQRNSRLEESNPIFKKTTKENSLSDCVRLADQLSFKLNKRIFHQPSHPTAERPHFNRTAPTHSPLPPTTQRRRPYPPYPHIYHTPSYETSNSSTPLTFLNFSKVFNCTQQWILTTLLRLAELVYCRYEQTGNCQALHPKEIMVYGWEDVDEPEGLVLMVKDGEVGARGGLYVAPEVVEGGKETREGLSWNLGVIVDELIHGELYFSTKADLVDPSYCYQFRDEDQPQYVRDILQHLIKRDPEQRLSLLELLSSIKESLKKA